MYPNPHIIPNAGIYLKEMPGGDAHTEYFVLRPDLLVEWSVVTKTEDGLDTTEMRGNWAVGEEWLNVFLFDDESGESYVERYKRAGEDWHLLENPQIRLIRRNPAGDIKDEMYYDLR